MSNMKIPPPISQSGAQREEEKAQLFCTKPQLRKWNEQRKLIAVVDIIPKP